MSFLHFLVRQDIQRRQQRVALALCHEVRTVDETVDTLRQVALVEHDIVEDGQRLHAAQTADDHEDARLHVVRFDALLRPERLDLGIVVDIEAVMRAHDAVDRLRCIAVCEVQEPVRRHSRIDLRHVLAREPIVTHDPLRNHEPAERDVLLHRAGRAHTDDVLHADIVEFLDTNASRRRADARRHHQDALPAVRTDNRLVFTVERPRLRVIHELRNRIHPRRVPHDDCPVRPNRMRQLRMRLRSLNFPFLVH